MMSFARCYPADDVTTTATEPDEELQECIINMCPIQLETCDQEDTVEKARCVTLNTEKIVKHLDCVNTKEDLIKTKCLKDVPEHERKYKIENYKAMGEGTRKWYGK